MFCLHLQNSYFYVDVMPCWMTLMVQGVTAAHMRRQTFSSKLLTLVFCGMTLGFGMTLWFVSICFNHHSSNHWFYLAFYSWISTCQYSQTPSPWSFTPVNQGNVQGSSGNLGWWLFIWDTWQESSVGDNWRYWLLVRPSLSMSSPQIYYLVSRWSLHTQVSADFLMVRIIISGLAMTQRH